MQDTKRGNRKDDQEVEGSLNLYTACGTRPSKGLSHYMM